MMPDQMREIQAKSKAAHKVRLPCRHIQQHELNLIPVSYLHSEKGMTVQYCQTKCKKFKQSQKQLTK
eukprot:scaffold354496_cov47-Attheya_sp.AAC.1